MPRRPTGAIIEHKTSGGEIRDRSASPLVANDATRHWDTWAATRRRYVSPARLTQSRPRPGRRSPYAFRFVERGGPDDCWLWIGRTYESGYGKVHGQPAHRVVYSAMGGTIPPGHELHHTCERRSCVNPRHLKAMPVADHRRLHLAVIASRSAGVAVDPDRLTA